MFSTISYMYMYMYSGYILLEFNFVYFILISVEQIFPVEKDIPQCHVYKMAAQE